MSDNDQNDQEIRPAGEKLQKVLARIGVGSRRDVESWISQGRIKLKSSGAKTTFHDPCYLGRQNGIIEPPRAVLQQTTANMIELPRNGRKSFCCGAGGAQMWKEEEEGDQRVNQNRMKEAIASGADTLALGCPFCMVMLTDAAKETNTTMQVLDVAEIVAAQME